MQAFLGDVEQSPSKLKLAVVAGVDGLLNYAGAFRPARFRPARAEADSDVLINPALVDDGRMEAPRAPHEDREYSLLVQPPLYGAPIPPLQLAGMLFLRLLWSAQLRIGRPSQLMLLLRLRWPTQLRHELRRARAGQSSPLRGRAP